MAGERKYISRNRKALHEFFILERFEAGIVLVGSEVKALRAGKVNLQDSYARVKNGEVWLYDLHIGGYENARHFVHEPRRARKLLLHRKEIRKLIKKTEEKGMTLAPVGIYFNEKNIIKIELGVAKGKKLYDKRQTIAKKDAQRDLERSTKQQH